MFKILKIIFRVYSFICTFIVTLLLIAALIIGINFRKITSHFIGNVFNSYNTELNGIISGFFENLQDDSLQFVNVSAIQGGGLQAAFHVDNRVLKEYDVASFAEKTNEEIISELGLSLDAIPREVINILSMVKETLVLDFVDENGLTIFNREISSDEIVRLLKQN